MGKNIGWSPKISNEFKSFGLTPNSAVVVDVIVNEEHDDYSNDGFNVGSVRFKYLEYGGHFESLKTSFWAYPLEVGVQEYPLIGETILVQKIQGIHFYTRRVNVNKTLQLNAFPNILSRLKASKTQQNRSISHQQARDNIIQQTDGGVPEEDLRNLNYKPRTGLSNLKHFDGDVIFQNRYGATIRLGSSQME
ncbi:MAG: hypothetical protein GTN59_10380, partial [Candidatus Dadabacteria bacterium]|nr:hypothetical protein [Candidatus Dadabacteria bacterium]